MVLGVLGLGVVSVAAVGLKSVFNAETRRFKLFAILLSYSDTSRNEDAQRNAITL